MITLLLQQKVLAIQIVVFFTDFTPLCCWLLMVNFVELPLLAQKVSVGTKYGD